MGSLEVGPPQSGQAEDGQGTTTELRSETRTWQENLTMDGTCVVERIPQLNPRRATFVASSSSIEGEIILELPLTVGVVGALLVPQVAALAAVAALVTSCTITVEREEPAAGTAPDDRHGQETRCYAPGALPGCSQGPTMHILIAFATRYGSTRGIAEAIAGTLQAAGHVVDVRNAGDVADVAAYDTVVLGSAIYNTAWLPAAAEFVCRNLGALADRPVWLFSVGTFSSTQRWPFGVLARQEPKDIQHIRQNVHPRDYHVFAGAVERDRLRWSGGCSSRS